MCHPSAVFYARRVPSLFPLLSAFAADSSTFDVGPVKVTQDALESGGYGLAALIFVTFGAVIAYLFRRGDARDDAHRLALEKVAADHAKALDDLRKQKDEQVGALSKAVVEMVEKQTKVMVEASMVMQRMERSYTPPNSRGVSG